MAVMVTGETPLGMKSTGADGCVPGIQFVSWYRMGHQLHTHRLCSFLFPVVPAWLRCLKRISPVECLTSTENTLGMDQKAWIPCFLHLLLLHRNKMCSRCMWQMDLVVYWLGHLMDGPGKDLFSICGQTSMHEFYINQLLNKLYTWF